MSHVVHVLSFSPITQRSQFCCAGCSRNVRRRRSKQFPVQAIKLTRRPSRLHIAFPSHSLGGVVSVPTVPDSQTTNSAGEAYRLHDGAFVRQCDRYRYCRHVKLRHVRASFSTALLTSQNTIHIKIS